MKAIAPQASSFILITMVTPSAVLFWWCFMMYMTTLWCFPDSAIGKKYILARTHDGGYALVPDESKVPGIPVSPKQIHFNSIHAPVKPMKPSHISIPLTNAAAAPAKVLTHDSPLPISLNKENTVLTKEENLVTLALQGRDGANGKPGLKGPAGESGPTGKSGPPGLRGEPGTCAISQFQCDLNLIKNLTARVIQLEKIIAKVQKPLGGQGN